MENRLNFNAYITFYPSGIGLSKMYDLLKEQYQFDDARCKEWMDKRLDSNGGYRDQFHSIISDFGSMFYNGTQCFETTFFEIEPLK